MIFVDQVELTSDQYNKLIPSEQGYSYYFQKYNLMIPNCCPYEKYTDEYKSWWRGYYVAKYELEEFFDLKDI